MSEKKIRCAVVRRFWLRWIKAKELKKLDIIRELPLFKKEISTSLPNSYFEDLYRVTKEECEKGCNDCSTQANDYFENIMKVAWKEEEQNRIRDDVEKLKPISSWSYNQRYSYNRAIEDVFEVLKKEKGA